MNFQTRFDEILKIKNITVYRVGKLTGISGAGLSKLSNPKMDTLNKISKALEISITVFDWTDQEFADWLRYFSLKGDRTIEEYAEFVYSRTDIDVLEELKSIEKCEMRATPIIKQLENAEDPNYINELHKKRLIANQDRELIKKIRKHDLFDDVNNYVDFQISKKG